jgi:hypothetical protein
MAISLFFLLSCKDDFEPSLVIVEENREGFVVAPDSLIFRQMATFTVNQPETFVPGMIGSLNQNSLYIGFHDRVEDNRVERILQYNLTNSESRELTYVHDDLVTKRMEIVDDKLLIIGGEFLNIYPLDLSTSPETVTHGLSLTRHSTAQLNNKLYVIGGGRRDVNSDKVYEWNSILKSMQELTIMPAPRVRAAGEVVDNKLYVFGGQSHFYDAPAEKTLFIFAFQANTWHAKDLPKAMYNVFASKHEHLIYVVGREDIDIDNDGNADNFNIILGVYDTHTDDFKILPNSLESNGWFSVSQMAVVDNKLYVVYGWDNGVNKEYSIKVADLSSK